MSNSIISCFIILAERAYDFITENGKKKMDYNLFCEFMKQFITNEEANHPINMGLELEN